VSLFAWRYRTLEWKSVADDENMNMDVTQKSFVGETHIDSVAEKMTMGRSQKVGSDGGVAL
jgi:hypothetical protein